MKRFLALLLLLGLPVLSWAGIPTDFHSFTATNVNTTITTVLNDTQNQCYTLNICNDGLKTAYYNLNGSVATTNNVPDGSGLAILSLECHKWAAVSAGNYSIRVFGIITAGADTTAIRSFCSPLK